MKVLKMSNVYSHNFAVIDSKGRAHAWCETESQAYEDLFRCLDMFPTSEIVKLELCSTVSDIYPDVLTVYKPE